MTFTQIIAPNPDIPCKPGWCLAYVNEAFGVKKVFPSATSAWYGSKTKHEDRDFPDGVWHPVWYGLDSTPLGHVVLRAPDGSVYSTSDLTNVPHHHTDLADLEAYYAYYGMTLTYRGWTEDVEGTPVIARTGIAAMAESITPIKELFTVGQFEDLLKSSEAAREAAQSAQAAVWYGGTSGGKKYNYGILPIVVESQRQAAVNAVQMQAQIQGLVGAIAALAKGQPFDQAKLLAGVQAAAEAGVKAGIKDGAVTVDVNVNGAK